MLRTEIIEAAEELQAALLGSNLSKLIGRRSDTVKGPEGADKISIMFEALKTYSIKASSFKPATKSLAKIFRLQVLERAGVWPALVDYGPNTTEIRDRILFAESYLPKIVEMLKHETLKDINESSGNEDSTYKGMRTLSVTVFEPERLFSSPLRLANVLESINHFYAACALMEGESPSTLSVIACDSGSDKSFDFLGLAKVMECVERLIGTIWDRAFFFRERQFEERLKLVADSLPIIERISTMEQQKRIEPELAAILRRHVFDGTDKFLQSGATISKIEDRSEYNPRALLSPVQKLLVAAPDDHDAGDEAAKQDQMDSTAAVEGRTRPHDKSGKLDLSDLTDEEQEVLAKLLGRGTGAAAARGSSATKEDDGNEITGEDAQNSGSDM